MLNFSLFYRIPKPDGLPVHTFEIDIETEDNDVSVKVIKMLLLKFYEFFSMI